MHSPARWRSFFNYTGIAILMLGLALGDFLYWRGLHASDDSSFESPYQTKEYAYEMQRTVGTFGSIIDEFSRFFADPRHLAIAIGALSLILSLGCFFIASRIPRG